MSAHIATVALYHCVGDKETEGLILEFSPYDMIIKYFTCSWISSFGTEDDLLFINY